MLPFLFPFSDSEARENGECGIQDLLASFHLFDEINLSLFLPFQAKARVRTVRRKRQKPHAKNPKPKKAPSAYNEFVRDYIRRHKQANKTMKDLYREAAAAWNNLSDAEKAKYQNRNANVRAKRKSDMEKYRAKQKALKRPGSGFQQFVSHLWQTEGNEWRRYLEVQDRARAMARRWKRLPEDEKAVYNRRSSNLWTRYKDAMERFENGGELDLNWRNAEVELNLEDVEDDGQEEEEEEEELDMED